MGSRGWWGWRPFNGRGICLQAYSWFSWRSLQVINGGGQGDENLPLLPFQWNCFNSLDDFWYIHNTGNHFRLTSTNYSNCMICLMFTCIMIGGQGNSTVDSVSVCQAGHPGSSPAWSACFRKVEFYQGAIDLFPPVPMTGSTKAVHAISCLCDNACKRSLAICHKSRASCPVIRLLFVPIWPACAEQWR